ncbi:MAG: AMP-binding protein [Clostridia bacterium]|nr:AMP-binding protein [Clostridia bacterium]
MELLNNYMPQISFESYEEFCENFKINVPENFDFARDIVDKWGEIEPDKKALIYCDDEGYEREFTFAEISELSKRAASYFASLGIKAGDRVITLMRRRWEYWVIAVAIHRMGAVLVPASIQLTTKDIAYRIDSAEAKMLIAIDDEFVKKQIAPVMEKCETLENIVIVGDEPIQEYHDFNRSFMDFDPYEEEINRKNEDEMVIYFTSGTSGYPKMAIHNRTYPLGHITTAKYMQCVLNNGLHVTQADSGWAKFGWGNIYGQWICGTAILGYDPLRFDAERFIKVIAKYKPTTLCVPPTMYRLMLLAGIKESDFSSVTHFATAGEPLSDAVNEQWKEITGKDIHVGFGQSEGSPICCTFSWLEVRSGSMGRPSPLYDVRILAADGGYCDAGEEGEIVIIPAEKQVGLLTKYSRDRQQIQPLQGGVYHTGDIAYKDTEGYFYYVCRNDDMIKSSGYRIGPYEIESVLNTHEAVHESAIVGMPDEIRGQIICAIIILNEGFTPSDELTKELQNYVKKNTAPYKYPRVIKYITEIPKTTSGKIMRKDLAALAESIE